MTRRLSGGLPPAASTSPHRVGSARSSVPDWLESRIRRASVGPSKPARVTFVPAGGVDPGNSGMRRTLAQAGKPCQRGRRQVEPRLCGCLAGMFPVYTWSVWAVAVFLVSLHRWTPVVRWRAFLLILLAGLTGCSGVTSRPWFGMDSQGYWLPLTVKLKLDSTVTAAALDYANACQQPTALPLSDRLKSSLSREIGMVFERVQADAGPAKSVTREAPDGEVQVALGLKELELFIPKNDTNSYAAMMTLGATVTYVDAEGTVLFTKKLRVEAKADVNTERGKCEVSGLDGLANEASIKLAQGIKKQLGTSLKIRQAASRRKSGGRPPTAAAGAATGGGASEAASAPAPVSAAPSAGPSALSFRAMLKDESQDQVLESGEQVTVKVEVKNGGSEVAKGVVVVLSGSPALVQALGNPISVGDLQPGETKRVEASGRVPPVAAVQQAELIVSVQSSAGVGQPQKKFIAALRPSRMQHVEVLSVDVDQIPEPVRGFERRKAAGIAIGIGAFRDADVAGVPFAVRDAEVMAKYLRAAVGIPAKRIKLITNEHALKEDLAEVFEDWLPQQVEEGGLAVVFFSGRALADPVTGAVLLLPHEGGPGAPSRAFSLRRLQSALARLPIQQAVLLLDVTLTAPSSVGSPADKAATKEPVWDVPAGGSGKIVQVVGVRNSQQAHQYEHGKHGLFTYYLLKGLGGEADRDGNGVVSVGELCGYARVQVSRTAKADYGSEQDPVCVPAIGPDARAWSAPLARVK
ncbi:MAG: hypothetical protein EPO64_04615 [Nitrospirae bacterium]|nr:MAG: hypothetical protein EPO64_04615 [Nitrospirota bacterium]